MTVAVAIVAVSLLRSIATFSAEGVLVGFVRAFVTAGGLFVVLYPMYYIFPDADVSVVEIVPGTAFAAVSLTIAHVLFTAFKSGGTGGNLIASILVLLTWLYITGRSCFSESRSMLCCRIGRKTSISRQLRVVLRWPAVATT